MLSARPDHYRLSPKSLDDLDDIWRYTAEFWSVDQADNYIDDLANALETLVGMPSLGREYTEFNPPVRILIHNQHLVVYMVNIDHISVLRFLGGRQNWRAILAVLDRD